MAKILLFCLMLLVLGTCAYAASSAEAINFVENTNHFIAEGETAEIYPVVTISHERADYWVVSLLGGESISGFVPIKDARNAKDLSLAKGELARKQLIKTAHYMRLYSKLKNDFSSQGIWVFKNTDVDFFNALSNDLKNERVDLTTIESELDGYASLQSMTSDLKGQLDELWSISSDIASKIGKFKGAESVFFSEPDTNALSEFANVLDDMFSLIKEFDSERASYLADLDKLKQGIAQTSLSVDSKRSLNALANVPQRMNEVVSRITNASGIKEKMDEVYAAALNQSDNFVQDLAVREKRSEAWLAIYGFDSKIVEETKLQGVDSLDDLAALILDEQYIYQWNDQTSIPLLQENWSKAKAYYNSGAFDSAKKFAEDSEKYALKIFKAGLAEPEQPINTDMLITGAVLLIIVLIVVYAIRNRSKLASLVSSEGEEEVPIHDWEK